MNHKAVVATAATLFLALACAPAAAPQAEPGQSASPSTGPAPSEPQPKRGGVMVMLQKAVAPNLHPLLGSAADQRATVGPAYESLLSFQTFEDRPHDADFQVIPWLAQSWEQPNETTYVFSLQRGARWHDGQPFTAADVVFTQRFMQDPANRISKGFSVRKDLAQVEAIDEGTVRMVTKTPSPFFLRGLADPDLMVLPKHLFDRGDDIIKVVLGTGPFRAESLDLSKELLYRRFDGYWQPGRPYLDGVSIKTGVDDSAQAAAFIAKQTDKIVLNSKAQLEPIVRAYPATQYRAMQPTYSNVLYPKLDRPPFNDVRVRKAIHLAIDRQAMIQQLTFGEGVINPPAIPGTKIGYAIPEEELLKLPGYRQPKGPDIAEAKRLLAEAGYGGGLKLTVVYPSTFFSTPPIAEAFAGQVRSIGVDMTLQGLPGPEFRTKEGDGNYDVIFTLSGNNDEAGKIHDYYHSKGAVNKIGLADARADAALDTIRSSMDPEVRRRAVLDLQYALLEGYYVIPTIELASYRVWQPWLHQPRTDNLRPILDNMEASQTWIDVALLPSDRR